MQRSNHLCEPWNEPSVIPHKPQKNLDLINISWGRSFLNGFYFTLIGDYSLVGDDMPQVGNLPSEQLTLGGFKL